MELTRELVVAFLLNYGALVGVILMGQRQSGISWAWSPLNRSIAWFLLSVGGLAGIASIYLFFSQLGFLYGLLMWCAASFASLLLNALIGPNAVEGLRSWMGLFAIVGGVVVWFRWA